ncbi:hypothetical protein Nmel_002896 [Mimus melanotis]
MEASRSEISAAEESEEVTYTSVKFSQTPLPRAKAPREKRGEERWMSYHTEIDKTSKLELIHASVIISSVWEKGEFSAEVSNILCKANASQVKHAPGDGNGRATCRLEVNMLCCT